MPTTIALLLSITSELFELNSWGCAQIEALLTQIKEFILSEFRGSEIKLRRREVVVGTTQKLNKILTSEGLVIFTIKSF